MWNRPNHTPTDAGPEDVESTTERRERLQKRIDEEKANGNRAFQKTVAEEEGIHISRLKQILNPNKDKHKSPSNTW